MPWIWLNSDYGDETHAFDVNGDINALPYVEAPCEHTAPPARLHPHAQGMSICVACILAVGATIPEGQGWRQ